MQNVQEEEKEIEDDTESISGDSLGQSSIEPSGGSLTLITQLQLARQITLGMVISILC